jgi:hypothetical protein
VYICGVMPFLSGGDHTVPRSTLMYRMRSGFAAVG